MPEIPSFERHRAQHSPGLGPGARRVAELVAVAVVADLTLGTGVPSSPRWLCWSQIAAVAVVIVVAAFVVLAVVVGVLEAAVPSSPRWWSRWPACSRWSRT